MALLTLNSKTLEIGIKVGVLETYSPDEAIQGLYNEVQSLKLETMDVLKKLGDGLKSQDEMLKILETDTNKKEEWKRFLIEQYDPKLTQIIEKIKNKNKEICPKFDEFLKNLTP